MASAPIVTLWWNSRISPPLGLLANFWLLWLVLYRTPKEMQTHSKILLQTCLLDIIFLLICIIGIPIIFMETHDGTLYVYDGLLMQIFHNIFGDLAILVHLSISAGFIMFDLIGISVQFLFRYFLLIHNIRFGLCRCRYLMLMSIPFVISCLLATLNFIPMYSTFKRAMNVQMIVNNSFDIGQSEFYFISQAGADELNSFLLLLWVSLYIPIYVFTYAIVIFCAIKMVIYVNSHARLGPNTKRLNRQLTTTLIILAFLPSILISFDIYTIVVLLLEVNSLKTTNDVDTIFQELYFLLPCLNLLISILTNTPYRNAAMFWRKNKNGNIQIQPTIVEPIGH